MSEQADLSRYDVPRRDLRAATELSLGEYVASAVLHQGPALHVYTRLQPSSVLRVIFHGAVRPGVDTYPRFDRVASSRATGDAFLSIADPTLTLGREIELAWYLGSSDWDPRRSIKDMIMAATELVGAEHVILIGGSGGGFAALRAGIDVPNSLAFVFNPQIVLPAYIKRVVQTYFEHAHPTAAKEKVMAADPSRFDLSLAYTTEERNNYVYYLQNLRDASHVRDHYVPFKRAMGLSDAHGIAPSGKLKFSLIDSEKEGHGPPTKSEFDAEWDKALTWYLQAREPQRPDSPLAAD